MRCNIAYTDYAHWDVPLQLDPTGFKAAAGGANQLNAGVTHVQAWGIETILTFLLVFVVFAATDSQRSAGTPHLPVTLFPHLACLL